MDSIAIYDSDGEPTRRYPEWDAAGLASVTFPFVGVGTGQYQNHIGQFYSGPDATGPSEPDTQNLFLVLLVSMGLPALMLFIGTLLEGVRGGLRGYIAGGSALQRGIGLGATGALFAFGINAIWAPLLVRGIGIPLVCVLMLAVTSCAKSRES